MTKSQCWRSELKICPALRFVEFPEDTGNVIRSHGLWNDESVCYNKIRIFYNNQTLSWSSGSMYTQHKINAFFRIC
jgi:hypothetical protein